MVGLMVFTLFVVPATGDCPALTERVCPVRPDSGTWLTSGLADWLAGGPCACTATTDVIATIATRKRNVTRGVIFSIGPEKLQLSILRKRQTLSTTSTSVKIPSIRKLSHSASKLVPLIMLERAITLKWRIGLMRTSGCSQPGIASAGVTAHDAVVSNGFTKKLVSCACC